MARGQRDFTVVIKKSRRMSATKPDWDTKLQQEQPISKTVTALSPEEAGVARQQARDFAEQAFSKPVKPAPRILDIVEPSNFNDRCPPRTVEPLPPSSGRKERQLKQHSQARSIDETEVIKGNASSSVKPALRKARRLPRPAFPREVRWHVRFLGARHFDALPVWHKIRIKRKARRAAAEQSTS